MPHMDLDDIRLRCEIVGKGPPLVVLMSLTINKGWFYRQTPELTKHFQLILIDNIGDKPGHHYSIAGMAEHTVNLMDELGLDSAHVLGVSMGGCIAQELALVFPQRVRSLVLACTTCGGEEALAAPKHIMKRFEDPGDLAHEEVLRRNLHLYFSDHFLREESSEAEQFIHMAMEGPHPAVASRIQIEALRGFASASRLPGLVQPTLITTGSDDQFIPVGNSLILAGLIPDASLMMFPQGRHCFYIEMADRFNRETASFLHQVDRT